MRIRKRRAVMIVRGMTRPAICLMDTGNPVSARRVRARRGAGNSRAPHSVRQSARTTARRLAIGSPTCEAPRDVWPGEMALKRPAPVRHEAEPQAEPLDILPDEVVALSAALVPRTSKGH